MIANTEPGTVSLTREPHGLRGGGDMGDLEVTTGPVRNRTGVHILGVSML
jgi:hypothetical protein